MLPSGPGTYVLIMRMVRHATVTIGKLGAVRFPAGWYAYAGSARGSGGLAARLSRHLRQSKSFHWHIDYLRPHVRPVTIWYTTGRDKRECSWAKALVELPAATVPSAGFGASDCGCPAHLIRFPVRPDILAFAQLVGTSVCNTSVNG